MSRFESSRVSNDLGFSRASSISQLSSLCKISESGPLSKSVKDEPTDDASVFAQFCHFWRSDRVAVKVGGRRNKGGFGFNEVGAWETDEQEMGLHVMDRWRVLDANAVERDETRAKLVRFINLIFLVRIHINLILSKY